MADDLGERISIENHEVAADATFERAHNLQIGASAIRWALEIADPELLFHVARDFGSEVTLDDLAAAAAAVQEAAAKEESTALSLLESADRIRRSGLPPTE